jgi:hypothetical protein
MLKHANQTSFKKGNPPPQHKENCQCLRCLKSSELGYKVGFKKDNQPWNKGKNFLAVTGELNSFWKGINACYGTVHQWIHRHFGNAQECVYCGKTKEEGIIDWANINHTFARKIEDYIPLCRSCHKIYDLRKGGEYECI